MKQVADLFATMAQHKPLAFGVLFLIAFVSDVAAEAAILRLKFRPGTVVVVALSFTLGVAGAFNKPLNALGRIPVLGWGGGRPWSPAGCIFQAGTSSCVRHAHGLLAAAIVLIVSMLVIAVVVRGIFGPGE